MESRELRLIITQNCNYNCYFCHREGITRESQSELDSDDYAFLFCVCKDYFKWENVTITGGEPLMNKSVDTIVEKIYGSGGNITLVTNGELLFEHKQILNKIKRINLSLHTLDEKKYEKIINRKNKMPKILRSIAMLRNLYPKVELRLNVVLIKDINDTVENIIELLNFAEKIKASIKFIELYADDVDIVKIDKVEGILENQNYKYYDVSNLSKKAMTNGKVDVILSRIFCANAQKQIDPVKFCNKYNDLFITPDGYINVCRNGEKEISLFNELKNRDTEGLIKKIEFAISSIGKQCIFNLERKKLAISGGSKIFSNNEGRFVHPVITKSIEKAIIEQLHDSISIYDSSNIFKKFETEFAKYHNKKYALLTSSGTAALWSMYEGIGLQPDDEIVCPSYTFFATNTAVLFTGAIPILIDCNEYGNIDYTQIERKITARTKAIVVTHMWGYPCQMNKLREIADKYGIYLLEDCSHAHGASLYGKKMGEWGDAAIFSLQGNKIITGGEGGILITNNKKIFDNALLLGHYNKRCKQELDKNGLYRYATTGKGMKLRAHPLAIRLAYEQLKNLDKINTIKQKYAFKIIQSLKEIKGLNILMPPSGAINSWYAMIIKYTPELMHNVSRESFVAALQAEGATEVDIPNSTCPVNYLELFQYPDLLYPNYKNKIRYAKDDFPNATKFYNSIIKIPIWYTESDEIIIDNYIKAFKKVSKNIEELI